MSGHTTPGTPLPWVFDRMDSAVEFAELKGETFEEHDGYFRSNDGRWIITYRGEDGEPGGQICEVAFKGTAKRGQQWCAPDPEGMANARYIVRACNAFPALLRALEALVRDARPSNWDDDEDMDQWEAWLSADRALADLRRAS